MNMIKVLACLLVWTLGLVSCTQEQQDRRNYCLGTAQQLRAYQACVTDAGCHHYAEMYEWIERDRADLAENCPTKP